jgi:beta-hydroxyacyl-ACP dehydratase FabZ
MLLPPTMPQKQQNKKGLFDIEKIQGMLPHRYPFLLIDRILDMEKGKSIVAIKNVTCNESFFQGHFPKFKVMPGVLIIEGIAQTGGVLLYNSIPDPDKKLVFLSKVDNAKFRKPVIPGDQLRFEVEFIKLKKKFIQIKGKALVDNEIVVECDIIATPMDIEELYAQG